MVAGGADGSTVLLRQRALVFGAQAGTSARVHYPANLNMHVLISQTNQQRRTMEENTCWEMRFFRQTLVVKFQQRGVNSHRTTTE